MTSQELVELTHTLTGSYDDVRQRLNVGDCLILLNQMYPLKHSDDSLMLLKSEWIVYPITKKTRTALYSGNYRWAKMEYNRLLSNQQHVVSCWATGAQIDDWLSKNQYDRKDEKNRFVISQTLLYKRPIVSVENTARKIEHASA